MLPICKMILGELSEWLSKSYDRNLIIEPDLDTISAISEKRQKIWETVNKSDFVSENEKRESLGYEGE